MLTAHSGHIVATAISADGKHLATHSHTDNKLKFWQVSFVVVL
jgi:WD40 repeat protein